jgi:hypothetical protein
MLQALWLNALHTRTPHTGGGTAYWRPNRPRIRQHLARTMTAAAHPRKLARRLAGAHRALLATVLAALLTAALGSIPGTAAAERIVADRHTGLALYGVDPVAFYTKRKPTEGSQEFELRYSGAIWRFENEGNRAAFIKDPAIYMPRYGGYDPIGIARGVGTAGYPALFSVVENRLYLFYAAEAQKIFLVDPHAAIAAADARWPEVMKDLPE